MTENQREYHRKWYQKNREHVLASSAQRHEKNRENINQQHRENYVKKKAVYQKKHQEYYLKNKELINQKRAQSEEKAKKLSYNRQYYKKCRNHIIEVNKKYRCQNREKSIRQCREYYYKNREFLQQLSREYYLKNITSIKEKRQRGDNIKSDKEREKARNYWQTHPEYRLHVNISKLVCSSLKGCKNGRPWEKLLGYTCQELKRHLETQFIEGMMWSNYGKGKWVIDHIRPRCSFNFKTAEDAQFKECWALSNLRPLWEIDNLKKARWDKKLSVHRQPQEIKEDKKSL